MLQKLIRLRLNKDLQADYIIVVCLIAHQIVWIITTLSKH